MILKLLRLKGGISLLVLFATVGLFFQNCSPLQNNLIKDPPSTSENHEKSLEIIVAFGDSLTRGSDPKNPANTGIKGYAPYLQSLLGRGFLLVNCGIGGQTTADALPRFLEILDGDYTNCSRDVVDSATTSSFYDFTHLQGIKPKQILLWLGTNNLLKNSPQQADSYRDLKTYIEAVLARNMTLSIGTAPPYSEGTSFASPSATVFGRTVDRIKMYNSMLKNTVVEYPALKWVDLYSVLEPNWHALNWDGIHLNSTANEMVANAWFQSLKNPLQPIEFQNGCQVAAGQRLSHGQVTCSCASAESGTLFQCINGEFEELGSLGLACVNQSENHAYMVFHCR